MCKMVNRIGEYLSLYQIFSIGGNNNNSNMLMMDNSQSIQQMNKINLLKMMDDFATLINCEENRENRCFSCTKTHSFEDIYNYIVREHLNGIACDLQKCTALKRNTRDRMNPSTHQKLDKELKSKIQILDSIHTSILHAFDTV